jgi:hypothetical protein
LVGSLLFASRPSTGRRPLFLKKVTMAVLIGLIPVSPVRADAEVPTVTLAGPSAAVVRDTMCYDVDVSPVPAAGSVSVVFTSVAAGVRTYAAIWNAPGHAVICVTIPVDTYEVVGSFDDGTGTATASDPIQLIVSKKTPSAGFWPSTQESSKSLWVGGAVDGVDVIPTGDATIYELVGDNRVLIGTTPLVYSGVYAISDATIKLPSRVPGTYEFEIDYPGSADLEPATGTGSITVVPDEPDIVPPGVETLGWSLPRGATVSGNRLPVRLTWTAKDVGTGIARYQASFRLNWGAWSTPMTAPADPWTARLSNGTNVAAIRGVDYADNVGAWFDTPAIRIHGVSQADRTVRYHGAWASSTSTVWWGGTARWSSSSGATVTSVFTGRSIAWVGLMAPNRGKAQVYVNGVYKATVDLYSATTKKQVIVWSANYAASATRTVTIRVLGTSGRPRVDIDGFIVAS